MSEADRESYNRAAQWLEPIVRGKKQSIRGRHERFFVTDDGMVSPNEDFANNLEYFIFEPKKFKEKTPQVYEWFENRYGDKLRLKPTRKK